MLAQSKWAHGLKLVSNADAMVRISFSDDIANSPKASYDYWNAFGYEDSTDRNTSKPLTHENRSETAWEEKQLGRRNSLGGNSTYFININLHRCSDYKSSQLSNGKCHQGQYF